MAVTDPTAATAADTDRLGCGRHIDDVWEHIDSPPDPHELGCPDCRAARANLAELAAATRQLSAADQADQTLRTSPEVLTTIVSTARAEVRRGQSIPLGFPDQQTPGELTISEQSIAGVIRRTCDDLDGVEARRCTVRLTDLPTARTPAGDRVQITVGLKISVSASVAIPRLARELRHNVRTAVQQQVGLEVTTINLDVEDIHE